VDVAVDGVDVAVDGVNVYGDSRHEERNFTAI
jgi:hypothetical protein